MFSFTRRHVIVFLVAVLAVLAVMVDTANGQAAPESLCLDSGVGGFTLDHAIYNPQNGRLYCYYPDVPEPHFNFTLEEFCDRAVSDIYPLIDYRLTIPALKKCTFQYRVIEEPLVCVDQYDNGSLYSVVSFEDNTQKCVYLTSAPVAGFCRKANPDMTFLRKIVAPNRIKCFYEV